MPQAKQSKENVQQKHQEGARHPPLACWVSLLLFPWTQKHPDRVCCIALYPVGVYVGDCKSCALFLLSFPKSQTVQSGSLEMWGLKIVAAGTVCLVWERQRNAHWPCRITSMFPFKQCSVGQMQKVWKGRRDTIFTPLQFCRDALVSYFKVPFLLGQQMYILITCQERIKHFYLKVQWFYASMNILAFLKSIFINTLL